MPGDTIIRWTHGTMGGIEYKGRSWNRGTGCTRKGPPCDFCYMFTFAEKWRGKPGHPYEQGADPTDHPDRIDYPLRWKQPAMIFVNSMSDQFHSFFSDDWIDESFAVMAAADWHIFQILTKRWQRMCRYYNDPATPERIIRASERLQAQGVLGRRRALTDIIWPLPHVWQGISIGINKHAYALDWLLKTNAAVRWVSFEPVIENLTALTSLKGLDWAVVGGESGQHFGGGQHRERWYDHAWGRHIHDLCVNDDVAFFFKQDSDIISEQRGWMLESDGTAMRWEQYPGQFTPPMPVYAEELKRSRTHLSVSDGQPWQAPTPEAWLELGKRTAEWEEHYKGVQARYNKRFLTKPVMLPAESQKRFDIESL